MLVCACPCLSGSGYVCLSVSSLSCLPFCCLSSPYCLYVSVLCWPGLPCPVLHCPLSVSVCPWLSLYFISLSLFSGCSSVLAIVLHFIPSFFPLLLSFSLSSYSSFLSPSLLLSLSKRRIFKRERISRPTTCSGKVHDRRDRNTSSPIRKTHCQNAAMFWDGSSENTI